MREDAPLTLTNHLRNLDSCLVFASIEISKRIATLTLQSTQIIVGLMYSCTRPFLVSAEQK
jgi:hypothetical protein